MKNVMTRIFFLFLAFQQLSESGFSLKFYFHGREKILPSHDEMGMEVVKFLTCLSENSIYRWFCVMYEFAKILIKDIFGARSEF